jgi:hypothetical protein
MESSQKGGSRPGIPTGLGPGKHRRTIGKADGGERGRRAQERGVPIPRSRRYREVKSHSGGRFTGGSDVAGNRREADHKIADDD